MRTPPDDEVFRKALVGVEPLAESRRKPLARPRPAPLARAHEEARAQELELLEAQGREVALGLALGPQVEGARGGVGADGRDERQAARAVLAGQPRCREDVVVPRSCAR